MQSRALVLSGLFLVGARRGPDEAVEIAVAPPGTEPESASAAAPLAPGSARVEYLGRDSWASFARDALRQRIWLAKKNPNPRKISKLRSNDRHMTA